MRIAFLGLGKMGRLMAGHLLAAGHEVVLWNRSPGPADAFAGRGARVAATPREAATGAEVVVTMLFDGPSVREVLLDGPDPVAAGAGEGTLVLDCSTIGPEAARSLAADLGARGLRFVDAPVAGSTPAAEKAALGVLLGGTDDDVAQALTVVAAWGDPDRLTHAGPVGAGQAMKLVMNLSLGLSMAALGECLRLAHDLGVDKAATLDLLAAGPLGWTVGQKRALLEKEDYAPATFTLEAMAKDVALAAGASHHDLALTAAALAAAGDAVTAGHGPEDYTALAGHLAFEGHANSQ